MLSTSLLYFVFAAGNVDVAYTNDVQSQSSRLFAILVKSLVSHSTEHNKTYLKQTWMCLNQFVNNPQLTNGNGVAEDNPTSTTDLRDA